MPSYFPLLTSWLTTELGSCLPRMLLENSVVVVVPSME